MFFYIGIFFLLIFFYSIRKNGKSFLIVTSAILILISTIRTDLVGIDHLSYKNGFLVELRQLGIVASLFKWDLGWVLLNFFVIETYDNWVFLLFIVACFTIIPIVLFMKKMTPDPLLAIILFYLFYNYNLSFSLIKQSLSISIFVWAIYFFNRNIYIKASLTYAINVLIHYSSLLVIPFIILSKILKNIKIKWVIIILSGTFVAGLVGFDSSFRYVISFLPFEKYAHYAEYNEGVQINRLNTYLFILPKNIACILFFYYLKNSKFDFLKNLVFLNLISANLFIAESLFSRFVLYLYPLEIVLLIHLIYSFKNKNEKLLVKNLVIFYGLIYFLYNLFTNRGGIIPYESIF